MWLLGESVQLSLINAIDTIELENNVLKLTVVIELYERSLKLEKN